MWFKKKKKIEKKICDSSTYHGCFTLRNQTEEMNDCEENDIIRFLHIMFHNSQEFVVLTPAEPIQNIQFIQAAQTKNAIEVEVSVERGGHYALVYKNCQKEECQQIFLDFFFYGKGPSLKDYQPVQFM